MPKIGKKSRLLSEILNTGKEFIAVKSYKAKGKRLTTFEIDEILELEPTRVPVVPEPVEDEKESVEDDEIEQPTLFDNEEE